MRAARSCFTSTTVRVLVVGALALVACVDVPASMRAQFADATPSDRSNYRKGPHGTAPAAESPAPPAADAAPDGVPAPTEVTSATTDGGVTEASP